VLFEKDVECQVIYVDPDSGTEDLAELNPYNETPTLLDRELVLYDYKIINEYLDERLPHPPLMPVDPVSRGRARLMIMRIQRDWLDLIETITVGGKKQADQARQVIRDGLISISPLFSEQPFMLGEEFSLVDCCVAPLLWRLPLYGIELPRQAKPMVEYSQRLFDRKSFKSSLSEAELEMRA
jgi:RNA polymerase-associated protein